MVKAPSVQINASSCQVAFDGSHYRDITHSTSFTNNRLLLLNSHKWGITMKARYWLSLSLAHLCCGTCQSPASRCWPGYPPGFADVTSGPAASSGRGNASANFPANSRRVPRYLERQAVTPKKAGDSSGSARRRNAVTASMTRFSTTRDPGLGAGKNAVQPGLSRTDARQA